MPATAPRSFLAALLVALCTTAPAADIGTLFYSPDQRAKMDRLRRGEPVIDIAEASSAAPRRPAVTGYVQRSDGRNTIWIDGRPVFIASPAAKDLLDPRIVQPQPSDNVLRIEEHGDKAGGRR